MVHAPTLETERLILRQPRPSDAESHFRHFNDWDVVRFLNAALPYPYTLNDSKAMLAKINRKEEENYFWAITLKNDDTLIGIIELRPNGTQSHRGFWLGKAYHNQGLMTEAIHATNDFWFDVLGREKMIYRNARGNPASSRLKEKTGARYIGEDQGSYLDADLHQTEIWELTKKSWQKFKETRAAQTP